MKLFPKSFDCTALLPYGLPPSRLSHLQANLHGVRLGVGSKAAVLGDPPSLAKRNFFQKFPEGGINPSEASLKHVDRSGRVGHH